MITTPQAYCPLCGRMLTVVKTVAVTRYADQVTYACVCGCGTSDLTVRQGKILSVTIREPEKHPSFRILAG